MSLNYNKYDISFKKNSFKNGVAAGFIENKNKHSFLLVRSLNGKLGAISIQMYLNPNIYARVDPNNMLVNFERRRKQSDAKFDQDACFWPVENKFKDGFYAFESCAYPGRFIRHQGYRLKVHLVEKSDLYEKDASFSLKRVTKGQ